jgi:predicted ABC-type ATPase
LAGRNVYVVAGPNGSGKTTFASTFLPEYARCMRFINADLIAKGLSPFDPERAAFQAGKIVLNQIQEYSRAGMDFGFETTLSGLTYRKLFRHLKDIGYSLHIYYLWIPSVGLAVMRIKERFRSGGHWVPERDVRRCYTRSLKNVYSVYGPLADTWEIFNNAGITPQLIATMNVGDITVVDEGLYDKIRNI